MSKLHLPNVTLMMADIVAHDLALLSLEDSLRAADYGDVVIFSDMPLQEGGVPGARWIQVPAWPSSKVYGQWLWTDLAKHLTTSHFLHTQWDSWITNPECWTDEFLEYDYIGSPWWTAPGNYNVGNGCGLRSTRLMKFLAEHPDEFPLVNEPPFEGNDDTTLSITYRKQLEGYGFKWPDEQLASRLAFEYTRPALDSKHFMFHDSFNFPQVLSPERLAERVKLMRENTKDAKMPTHLDMMASQPNGDVNFTRGGVSVIRPSLAWGNRK